MQNMLISPSLLHLLCFLKMKLLTSANFPILFVTLCISVANRVDGNIFTSISVMENIFNKEMNVRDVVDVYIKRELERHQRLRQMAIDYESRTSQWLQNIDRSFLQNPVAAYSILKHLASGWMEIEGIMRRNSAEEVISEMTSNSMIPSMTDVEGAAVALIRLQYTYKLDTDLLANGNFPGVPQYGALSAKDCYDIGLVAHKIPDNYQTILWLEEAINRMQMERNSPSMSESQILSYLASTYFAQNLFPRAIILAKRRLELEPDNPKAIETLKQYQAKIQEINKNGTEEERKFLAGLADGKRLSIDQLNRNKTRKSDLHYQALCRGENNAPTSGLTCYYKEDTPFLRLARMKVEIAHLNPDILLFKDVVSPVEVEKIKQLAEPMLIRSEVGEESGNSIASYRISSNTWLYDELDPVVASLSRRVGDMTNLDMEYAETCQVANYGLGGHYNVHHDCSTHYMTIEQQTEAFGRRYNSSKWSTDFNFVDRIATVMFYLVQPISGGATVYPKINLTIFPTSGDAVFWFNSKKNGYEDWRVVHAGCPVLTGSKWVLNKWISVKNQEIVRPCSLKQEE